MRRYYFLAHFDSPQEGPDFSPVFPFDKVEIVQGEKTIYPPSPEDTCIVSIECQEHTSIIDAENEDPLWPSQRAVLLAPLEAKMEQAIVEMSEEHPYLGVENV